MKTKICVACAQEKPAMAFSLSPNSSAPDKLSIYCTACGLALGEKEKARLHLAHWRKGKARKLPGQSAGDAPIETEEYQQKLAAQNGVCAICAQAPKSKRKTAWLVDKHRDGGIRGLLCDSCYQGLGGFGADAARLKAALRYLETSTDEP